MGAVDNFERCIEHVRRMEGGYSNRASDPGGPTNYGITQTMLDAARQLWPDLPRAVEVLTWDEAKRIYRYHFWDVIRGNELPLAYALPTLDAAVNHGPQRAIRFLQQALGVRVDGWMGTQTIASARTNLHADVLEECLARRAHFYMLQDSMDDEYGLGWSRRLMRTFSAALKEL